MGHSGYLVFILNFFDAYGSRRAYWTAHRPILALWLSQRRSSKSYCQTLGRWVCHGPVLPNMKGSLNGRAGPIRLQSERIVALWPSSTVAGVEGTRAAVGRAGGYGGCFCEVRERRPRLFPLCGDLGHKTIRVGVAHDAFGGGPGLAKGGQRSRKPESPKARKPESPKARTDLKRTPWILHQQASSFRGAIIRPPGYLGGYLSAWHGRLGPILGPCAMTGVPTAMRGAERAHDPTPPNATKPDHAGTPIVPYGV
jgi:hypothetical protein